VVNYITKRGVLALQAELTHLRTTVRPKIVREVTEAAAQGDRSENAEYIYGKKKLREIDKRMRFLKKRIDDAEVLDPSARAGETRVFFGATVTVEDEDCKVRILQIVGIDEVDVTAGRVSYASPIGAQMLRKRAGDNFTLKALNGETEYTILAVLYE
jgi:transcription elongation factor GreB